MQKRNAKNKNSSSLTRQEPDLGILMLQKVAAAAVVAVAAAVVPRRAAVVAVVVNRSKEGAARIAEATIQTVISAPTDLQRTNLNGTLIELLLKGPSVGMIIAVRVMLVAVLATLHETTSNA